MFDCRTVQIWMLMILSFLNWQGEVRTQSTSRTPILSSLFLFPRKSKNQEEHVFTTISCFYLYKALLLTMDT